MKPEPKPGAFEGVRVIDLTQMMAGAYCSAMLADMGADVIKVERAGLGDDTRRFGSSDDLEASQAFSAMNRNKRGISVDLKNASAVEALVVLIGTADIIIENFRPGVMDRLGLGYEKLSKLYPTLIYCSISGFGSTGPYRELGGFDIIAQAVSGIMSMTGEGEGRRPVKTGVPICDMNAGMYATVGIMTAYVHRLRTGRGQFVDTSLFEAGVAYTPWETALYFAYGEEPVPIGSAHRLAAPYQCLRTADGWIAVGAANDRNWAKFCTVLGVPELIDDPRYDSNAHRLPRREELEAELEVILSRRTTAEWQAELEAVGVPSGPVNKLSEVFADPQFQAREMLVEVEHPRQGAIKHLGAPVKLSETPWSIRRPAPLLGQHTSEVLVEAGLSDAEVLALLTEGAFQQTDLESAVAQA